jgi:effector-binding domain-containing protein
MEYEVVVERVAAHPLAAVRGTVSSRAELGPRIIALLDQVWPVLRQQRVPTGHNVVLYFGSPFDIAAGVEVFDQFQPTAIVQPLLTPEGEVATTAHWGDYSELRGAYAALERWCAASHRSPSGLSWEIYGDWHADPAQRRTDVYLLLRP